MVYVVVILAGLLPVFIITIMNISSLINRMHLWSCTHVALSAILVMFYNTGIACRCAGNHAAM